MALHPLLKQQFDDSREDGGQLDLRKLLHAISEAYAEWDEERKGVVRSMRLLADETSAFTREVRESAAAQLQVILDHVKDAIITVDETGRIETLNTTGERVFGYGEQDVRGKKLDLLIPSLARPSPHRRDARGTGDHRREHPRRPQAARDQGPAPQRQPVRRRDRREQGAARPPRALRRLHARDHRTQGGRGGDPRKRGALPHAGRERARSHRRPRHGHRPVRRMQRERRALLQDDARRTARRRAREDQPAVPAGRLAVVRRRTRASRSCARRRRTRLRMAAPRCARARHPLRGPPGAPALLGPAPDPRQHHRHHRAQAQRTAGRGRPARVRTHHEQRGPDRDARGDHGDGREGHAGRVLHGVDLRRGVQHAAARGGHAPAAELPRCQAARRDRPAQRLLRRRDLPAPPGDRRGNHARRALGTPARAGRRGWTARLLVHAGARIGRPHARHGRAVFQAAAQPAAPRLRTHEPADGARRHRHRAQAVRGSPAPQRSAVPQPVRERHRRRVPLHREGPLRGGEPRAGAHARLRRGRRPAGGRRHVHRVHEPERTRSRAHRPAPRRRRPRGGMPAAATRRHADHRADQRPRHPRRDGRDHRLRRHDHGHHRAQARGTAAVRGKGKGAGHAAVDRRRGHHDRRRRPRRVPEPGRRGTHRLGFAGGARPPDRRRVPGHLRRPRASRSTARSRAACARAAWSR